METCNLGRKGVGLVRLIDADTLEKNLTLLAKHEDDFRANVILGVVETVRFAKTIDAVPVDQMVLYDLSINTKTRTAKAVFLFGDKKITLCRDCGELAPVVHGRWIPVKLTRRTTEYKCSICGRWEKSDKQPYCNCGAKMDGGADRDN